MKSTHSQGNISSARNGLSLPIAVLLGLTVMLGIFTLILKQTVLNLQFNQEIIKKQQVVEEVTHILPDLLLENVIPSNVYPAISSLLLNPSKGIVTSLIPSSWVEKLVDLAAADFVDFVQSDQQTFFITIGMSDLKQAIGSQTAELTNSVIKLMPECTTDQMLAIAKDALTGKSVSLPFCKPLAPFDKLLTPLISNGISALVSRIPLQLSFDVFSLSADNFPPQLATIIWMTRYATAFFKIAPYLVILLFLALFWTSRKSALYGFHLSGIALIIAGIGLLIVTAIFFIFGSKAAFSGGGTALDQTVASMANSYLLAVIKGIDQMLLKSAALLIVGGGVLALAVRKGKSLRSS